MISFWDGPRPVVALTYYATHPQSYYRTGLANPDFPGIARDQREQATKVAHVHFDGAGGNIGAGKWNDGSPQNRQILADRVAAGMAGAWAATVKTPITAADIAWQSLPVLLPPSPHLDAAKLEAIVSQPSKPARERAAAASELVWLRRCQARDPIDIACLQIGKARVLHMPGELFVEYQLAAQKLRPTCSWPWLHTATTRPAISEPRSPTLRAATRPAPGPRWSHPRSNEFLSMQSRSFCQDKRDAAHGP